ncbi:short-chain dehydrogenase/reductase SDR [Pirellula staleyi DSM 6068]|uniref:Short-chain dehydrogenase/reductase SDR n=1 Tax=Pirellula staleyi (strain ATCC 27377 / DSM 6068 / ICPB 4128) TaxID=530564 RepID=D2QZ50_PIRSD|nr:SDR family NAD(P)-dependent oxidoreductase [Pirellula staleyi]ADB18242.1 short-chain dehydrogenase/reductase SDR [Pirellula staleyi DSM 6068]
MGRRTLVNARVIVTGATSGIGRSLVVRLVREGARVVAIGRRADRLQQLVSEVAEPDRLTTLAVDVTECDACSRALALAQSAYGGLDILVNNAGLGGIGLFSESSPARVRDVMEVNFFAPVEWIRQSLPILRQGTKPLIVNVGSVLGHRAVPRKSEYCASKFALHGFSDALRAELAHDGIDVLLASPSTTASEFFDASRGQKSASDGKGGMSPDLVADRIVRAMQRGQHEVIMTVGGKLLVWLDRLCPPLANRLVAWWG